LDATKDVWTTLRMAHKGSKPVRKAKVEMLEGQLNRLLCAMMKCLMRCSTG
jgi:hypothetical protein